MYDRDHDTVSTIYIYRYMRCFYFALKTATKIGKNPKPENNVDRTFMIFNWLIGVFICAAIIGQVGNYWNPTVITTGRTLIF